jgi:hypothetical protein
MAEILSVLVFLFVIVLPAIAIFSFTSTVTRGVYHWAESQTEPSPPPKTKRAAKQKKINKQEQLETVEQYLGFSERFEDSDEFKQILDNYNFDVRSYLKKR